eukprot:CAMPEP_0173367104 /NCGR_PEP_ID=MMETSP1144-20121109/24662_1 /TAXON_ID=483371 /ORGANISM="non described non described, Strain CCMP2298" /LENGTH=82 /DNA_ID=CAMNT_0014317941 /DNA_START=60 /DNA_END=305 /DNA_ORIENTATION=+
MPSPSAASDSERNIFELSDSFHEDFPHAQKVSAFTALSHSTGQGTGTGMGQGTGQGMGQGTGQSMGQGTGQVGQGPSQGAQE